MGEAASIQDDPGERRTVYAAGIRTSYLQSGDPASPPLVLVHDGGYGTDAYSCWGGLIPTLARSFHVVAPDLIGHGDTAKLVSFEMDAMTFRVGHLAAFCTELGLERPSVVGSSFGGAIVLNLAARHIIPIARAVSLCGTGGLFMVPERFSVLQNYEPSLEAAAAIERELIPSPTESEIRGRYERSLAPGHWEVLSSGRLRNPAAGPPPDWRPAYEAALATIDVPVLLVAGSDDDLFESGWEKQLSATIPASRTAVINGAKHQPHRSHPGEVEALFDAFLPEG